MRRPFASLCGCLRPVSLLTPAPSEAVANEFDHYMDEGGAAVEKVVQ